MLNATLIISTLIICSGLKLKVLLDKNYDSNVEMQHHINLLTFISFVSGVCVGECLITLFRQEKCASNKINELESLM